ncbi:MAG: 30S ribosomal protein S13 [Candidatus Berkelbacteria bacterium]|nr:30S ribosomal protein S13 [Candidatus Berkelbacteria bacterium]
MIRIAGVMLPENKHSVIALTYIEGIGLSTAKKILKTVGVREDQRLNKVDQLKIEQIRQIVEKQNVVEGDLRVEISNNIKRLKLINAYRGLRHTKNLPVRGQRTKTNARTKRGKKITVGSGRKKAAEKT